MGKLIQEFTTTDADKPSTMVRHICSNGAELVTTLLALIWASSPYVRFEFSGKIVDSVLGMISDLNTNGGIIITRESPLCVLSPQCCVGSNAPSRQGGSSPYRSVELA